MSKFILKSAKRKTIRSRAEIRDAVAKVYGSLKSARHISHPNVVKKWAKKK